MDSLAWSQGYFRVRQTMGSPEESAINFALTNLNDANATNANVSLPIPSPS
jgi:hypothetical protein